MKIQIPSTLKKQLVDDWEYVNQQDQVSCGVFTVVSVMFF